MEKTVKIISANVCGNKSAAADLRHYKGRESTRIFEYVYRLAERNPDVIALEELPNKVLGILDAFLHQMGYKMFIHKDFYSEKRKSSYTCLTVLFIKNNLEFHQEYISGFETQYRYAMGYITIGDIGERLYIKANHTPGVGEKSGRETGRTQGGHKHLDDMIRRKSDFLEAELYYQRKMEENGNFSLSLGDYNCGAGEYEYYGQEIFSRFPFSDLLANEDTWYCKPLDHVFVSRALQERANCDCNLLYYPHSDHKAVQVTLVFDD